MSGVVNQNQSSWRILSLPYVAWSNVSYSACIPCLLTLVVVWHYLPVETWLCRLPLLDLLVLNMLRMIAESGLACQGRLIGGAGMVSLAH